MASHSITELNLKHLLGEETDFSKVFPHGQHISLLTLAFYYFKTVELKELEPLTHEEQSWDLVFDSTYGIFFNRQDWKYNGQPSYQPYVNVTEYSQDEPPYEDISELGDVTTDLWEALRRLVEAQFRQYTEIASSERLAAELARDDYSDPWFSEDAPE